MASLFPRNTKVLLHSAFWLVYASFFFYQISYGRKGEPDWSKIVPDFFFHIASLLIISYITYFFLLPKLLKDQNVKGFLLTFLPIFGGMTYLMLVGKQYLVDGLTHQENWVYSLRFGLNVAMSAFLITAFVGLLKFVEDYFELEARRKDLENQQLMSELRFLKAQINPHFLFNTLNNLYYLAYNQSPRTPEVIAKLSGMMRYMLYDSNHAKVPLTKEIEYIENYLDLERLRLNDEVPITFEVEGDVANAAITPLILITFLENAFKHGVSNTAEGSWITVSLSVRDGYCYYRVANSMIQDSGKAVLEKSGIGLRNVRRRLDLSYPGQYELEFRDDAERYVVDLALKLEKSPVPV